MNKQYRKARYFIYRETNVDFVDHLWTFIGAFVGIGLIGWIQSVYLSNGLNIMLIGSFGATAVLLYGASNSPLAQPRNLIGGHFISAFIGVTVLKFLPHEAYLWLAATIAVSFSIVAMQITKTLHPPGGATALIATIGSEEIKSLGYLYVLSPVLSGVLILFAASLIINKIYPSRNIS